MAARKAAPAVVQDVMAGLGADIKGYEFIGRRAGGWFTARQQIGARTADGVFYGVGEEGGQNQGDEEAENGDMVFVGGCTEESVESKEEEEREDAGVDNIPSWQRERLANGETVAGSLGMHHILTGTRSVSA